MSLQVAWVPRALDQLAAMWNVAPDRQAVSNAADEAERRILADPNGAGESREADERILFEPPLVVRWRVAPSVGHIFIVSVVSDTTGGQPR